MPSVDYHLDGRHVRFPVQGHVPAPRCRAATANGNRCDRTVILERPGPLLRCGAVELAGAVPLVIELVREQRCLLHHHTRYPNHGGYEGRTLATTECARARHENPAA